MYYRLAVRIRLLLIAALLISLFCQPARADQNIALLGKLDPLPENDRYADVWGEGHFAYLASFSSTGILIIDISVPSVPVVAGRYNPTTGGRFQDVIVINGIGYFSSEDLPGQGVHIVDVRNPSNPVMLSQITVAQSGFSRVHELFVADGLLYEADSRTNTVKVFDVGNPSMPVFLRDVVTTDTRFIHAISVINDRLYTSGWGGRTDIFDVTRIRTEAPTLLGTVETGTQSHSNWVSSDGRLLVSARETINGDVRVFDISDPQQPILRASITAQSLGASAFSAHNPYLVGNLLYVAWYQAGLLVIDISNPSMPKLVGSFDTFDESASGGINGFQGNWGVYPFLGLDRVLLSDLDGGLFIVDTTAATPLPRTVSAASFTTGAIAGKAIVAAFGADLAVNTLVAGTLPLPTSLGGTSVRVRDSRGVERLAPLFFVSPSQVNYQIPAGTAEGAASITVTGGDGRSATGVTVLSASAPAVFSLSQNGQGAAAAVDAFTGANGPFAATRSDGFPNVLAVFATGLGADATDADGNFAQSVTTRIDNQTVSTLYAGRAPGFIGLNQLNVMLPVGIASGPHSLDITRRGVASKPVTITIQ